MDTPTARTRTTGETTKPKLPKIPQTRWHTHYGQFNLDIKVTVINKKLAYLDYTKNQMNNVEHREVVSLTFIDRYNDVTLEEKIKSKSASLVNRLRAYNEDFLERQRLAAKLEEEINHDKTHR